MTDRPLRILQVNSVDSEGGAAKTARSLFLAYRQRGYESWLAVGHKRSQDPDVFVIPNEVDGPYRTIGYSALQTRLARLADNNPGSGWGLLGRSLRLMTHPGTLLETWRGIEDFDFPGTYRLLALPPSAPTIVHCHNLHQGYFDLRALPWLSQQLPVMLTLHDAWLLSGHCAHSLDCERWKSGCGSCPYLKVDPPIRRDATADNWQRKREIYAGSRFYVAAPCNWLMQRVEQSQLAQSVIETRVIPYGVDLSIFRPADRKAARESVGLSEDVTLVLFAATNIRDSCWKDWHTMRAAASRIAETFKGNVLFIGLGEEALTERVGQAEMRFIQYQRDPEMVARWFQAADLYLHPARADSFPNTILEALACGVPVVATAVGGIPEQVKGFPISNSHTGLNGHGPGDATGILVPQEDAEAMGEVVVALLKDDTIRNRLGENAARDARERFDLDREVQAYLKWYESIDEQWNSEHPTLPRADF